MYLNFISVQINDVQYSTIQPHDAGETAGAQGDDVQYSSIQFKKAGVEHG